MTYYRFWSHDSGETYAIRMTDQGDITGVCGPIHYTERTNPLNDFEYDTEDIDWVIDNSAAFRDTTTPEEGARRK